MARLSARHPAVTELRRLARRADERRSSGKFVIEGRILVDEALAAGVPLETVFIDLERADDAVLDTVEAAASAGARLEEVRSGVLDGAVSTRSAQPIAAVAPTADTTLDELVAIDPATGPVVVLDEIADPGNVGTLFRSADAAGAAALVCCGGVDPFGPKVVRASAGSLFRVPFAREADAPHAVERLGDAGWQVIGTDAAAGVSYDAAALAGPIAFVFGNESHGVSEDVGELIATWVQIPMRGSAESLNVAIAGSVLLFEAARQRRNSLDTARRNLDSR